MKTEHTYKYTNVLTRVTRRNIRIDNPSKQRAQSAEKPPTVIHGNKSMYKGVVLKPRKQRQ